MKVSIITLGCRVNQAESDSLEATLKENGATIVELKDNPDVCIVNTCTVTAESDHNSRQLIRRASRAGSRVIVTGCYSQMKPSEVSAIPGVEKVIDNSRKDDIIGFLGYIQTRPSVSHPGRSRPYLKVQDGCNFRCAYCSVPFARGRSRSLPLDAALQRARDLEEAGFKEIVLTGIHLGTYGQDLPVKSSLSSLVAAIIKETRDCRVRLSSV
nr:radical SAM protein [Nitrospiraceae bacterium]